MKKFSFILAPLTVVVMLHMIYFTSRVRNHKTVVIGSRTYKCQEIGIDK